MKFSLKLPDDRENQNPIVKGKLPISIFNQPFSSSFTSAINSSSSDLSFSLSSNFLSGPCLKLTYSPIAGAGAAPFSLCLKSGLGLFGSPQNSPLVFSAQFSLSPTKPAAPTFSLLLKPQFGHFLLKKSTVSGADSDQFPGFHLNNGAEMDSGSHSNTKYGSGLAADESMGWQELKLEPCSDSNGETGSEPQRHLAKANGIRDGICSGVAVMARTVVPVTKKMAVNLRWGMNFPANLGTKMPYLTVNKISVERVEEEKEEKKQVVEKNDMELVKGMLFWMKNDMETLERENKEMKQVLEEMRAGRTTGKKVSPPSGLNNINGGQEENEGKSKNRKYGEKSGSKGQNCSVRANEVESELERAIKAASLVKA